MWRAKASAQYARSEYDGSSAHTCGSACRRAALISAVVTGKVDVGKL